MNLNIKKKQDNLFRKYGNKIKLTFKDDTLFLDGELDSYDDILDACFSVATKNSKIHVVNNIKLKGYKAPKINQPSFIDYELDKKEVDVLIIGGGVIGASILRELSRYNLKILLVDKEADLANQASGRNDGEIHPGVDLSKGSLKQSLVIKGNRMYDQVAKELDVEFKRVGQYAAFTNWLLLIPVSLFALSRKLICGVDDTKIVFKNFIKKHDPNLNPKFKFAIYNSMAGCVSPYQLTIAYAENAVQNGAEVSLNTIVKEMVVKDNKITKVITNRGTILPKLVINAAGVFSDTVADMAHDKFFSIHPRRGTDIILDKKVGMLCKSIASIQHVNLFKSTKGHTKGGGILHTVHDNLLLGPDAVEIIEKEDIATYPSGIKTVMNKQKDTAPVKNSDVITYFSGVRAPTFEEDFVIERGRKTKNIYHVAGIQSPGLTCAPSISKLVSEEVVKILKESFDVTENKNFNPYRKGIPALNKLSDEERAKLIKENPDYGVIICRCEEISKGEIIDALNSPIKVATIDGIKRRVRPGMGRCQGSFCMPLVAKIISEHENIQVKDVLKRGENSNIGFTNTKGDIKYE